MTLFINACVRRDSRTERLARCLLEALGEPFEELRLEDCDFPRVTEEFLLRRELLVSSGQTHDPLLKYAVQFAKADEIVIAAPFWDLSFPASLKAYLEQVNVVGVTFRYGASGIPQGLCSAGKLWYVTTAGGLVFPADFGFGYVKALAGNFYGIDDVELIKGLGLDMEGAPAEEMLREREEDIRRRVL